MIERLARFELEKRLGDYPAVALIGPRQCGKTTLARSIGGDYFDLEQPGDRLRLDLEWDSVASGDRLVILDEAQEWPEVFSRLRGAIDADRGRSGRFLLLGSVAPSLMHHVSESLAGRLSLIELTPLLLAELGNESLERHWLFGGYPDGGVLEAGRYPDGGVLDAGRYPDRGVLAAGRYPRWEIDYLALLAQRDLPHWGLTASPQTTDRLLRMLAALHGHAWNASQVGASLGITYHTVNGYLDYLAGAFLIRRLRPWQSNVAKRLVKTPKVYWRDSGLLHALLGVRDRDSLLVQPSVGMSWEGYVVEQIISTLDTRGVPFNAWYFRTSDGVEIDLVLEIGNERWAIEVKLTASPSNADMSRLDKAADMIDATHRFLISQTAAPVGSDHRASHSLASFLEASVGTTKV